MRERKNKIAWLGHIKSIFAYLIIFIVLGWGMDLWRAQSIASGQAPQLVVTSVQGEKINLMEMSQEKPVLVYFWATWCGVCTTVSPSVDLMNDHYQVITVALTSGDNEHIQKYLKMKEYDFTVVNDPKGVISRDWRISVTPTLFVVNKGEITSVTTGFTSPFGMWARLLLN